MSADRHSTDAGNSVPFAHPEALNDPEKLLAAYFSSATVGMCILDTNFRYIAVNQTLAEINGVPARDHLGKTLREILGDFSEVVQEKLREVLSTGEPLHIEVSGKLPPEPKLAIGLSITFPSRMSQAPSPGWGQWSWKSQRRRSWSNRYRTSTESCATKWAGDKCWRT